MRGEERRDREERGERENSSLLELLSSFCFTIKENIKE